PEFYQTGHRQAFLCSHRHRSLFLVDNLVVGVILTFFCTVPVVFQWYILWLSSGTARRFDNRNPYRFRVFCHRVARPVTESGKPQCMAEKWFALPEWEKLCPDRQNLQNLNQ